MTYCDGILNLVRDDGPAGTWMWRYRRPGNQAGSYALYSTPPLVIPEIDGYPEWGPVAVAGTSDGYVEMFELPGSPSSSGVLGRVYPPQYFARDPLTYVWRFFPDVVLGITVDKQEGATKVNRMIVSTIAGYTYMYSMPVVPSVQP
jgi:hypothetical protein